MRKLSEIAQEILKTWSKPNYAAAPYIQAMSTMENIEDGYYQDSGWDIVGRFLANARTWRGADAKRIKAELNSMMK